MKAKHIAENGILGALTVVILYVASIFPINTFSILTVASVLIPISIIRTSIRDAILLYIASSILCFFLIKTNIAIFYILFFGIYGIIKYFIEKIQKVFIEILLKLISFNILLAVTYFIVINFIGAINLKLPLYFLWIIGQIAFLIYDYALTIIISFYLKKIHKLV